MMGQDKITFRSAFLGGYVKSDVIDYIDQLEESFRAKLNNIEKILASTQNARSEAESKLQSFQQSNHQAGIKKLTTDLEGARKQADRLASQVQEKEEELRRATEEKTALEKLVSTLTQKAGQGNLDTAQLQELNQEIASKERLCADLRTKNSELLRQLEELKAEDSKELDALKQKTRELQEKLQQIEAEGGSLEAVQAKAAQIEEDARKKADRIIQEAQAAAQEETAHAKMEADAVVKQMQSDFARIHQEFTKRLAQASDALTSTKGALDQISGEVETMETDFLASTPIVLEVLKGSGTVAEPQPPIRRVK